MKNVNQFKGKQILVLGLAKSGYAAAKLLHELGAKVVVNDIKAYEENEGAKRLDQLGIEVICGKHPDNLLDRGFDLVVKNPGIPYHNQVIAKALEIGITVITEVELSFAISEADIIGITGSNGKTTTTTLIYNMLKQDKQKALLAGNIGLVACEIAKETVPDQWLVMELSSFQLMGIKKFRPKISILLNLFDAHLDYHGTKQEYGKAKANLFKNQTEADFCIVNADNEDVVKLAKNVKAQKIWFSTKRRLERGVFLSEDTLFFNDEKIITLDQIVLPGKHNLENILAAVGAAKLAGVHNDTIVNILNTFTGVKHRLQYVGDVNNRKFYNDSKATNILATEKAVTAFNSPVILLAGGLDRGNSFDALIPSLHNVKAVVTFGQTAKKIAKVARKAGIKDVIHVDNVEKAVPEAYKISKAGDVILLSPACASWDQHKTFEERGDIFIETVHKL